MIIIYPKFYSLETEKRERIINAAIKEFAQNGYEKSSTNVIIKEANIAKGSLFSYFNNKRELYLFLLDYMLEVINKIYDEVDWDERDFFIRIKGIGLIKFDIMKKFPQVFDFLKSLAHEESIEVKAEIDKMSKYVIKSGSEKIYENIDLTKFRDDIDIQKTINIINWTIQSFAEQLSNQLNSFEDINMKQLCEWDSYFDIMKRCFYKKGEDL